MKYFKIILSDLLFIWLGILLLISFYFLYQQINQLSDSERWVNTSNEVKLKLEQVLSSVKDAETGQRGFLLSHDSIFLEPYIRAGQAFEIKINDLKELLDNSDNQKGDVDKIKELGLKRLDALNVLIYLDSRRNTKREAYLPMLVRGKQLMDSLRFEVTNMMVHQDEILKRRVDERNRENIITPLYAFIFFVLTLGVLIYSFLRIKRQLREQLLLKKEVDESKLFLNSVLDTTPNSIVVYDSVFNNGVLQDFRIIHANKSTDDPDIVYSKFKVGNTLLNAIPNAKENGIYDHFVDVLTKGKSAEFDFEYENNTTVKWYKVSLNKLNNGITASMTDITVIKNSAEKLIELNQFLNESNKELRNAQSFLQTLIDSSIDMILVYDKEFNIIMLNKPAEREYQLSRETVAMRPLQEIFKEIPATHNLADLKKALSGKYIHNEVVRETINDKYFETFNIPLKNENLTFGVLLIIRDISDIVKASEQLAVANRKLERKNQQLEQSNQELASFSYVASHDLQEPLRKIQSFSNRIVEMEAEKFSPTARDYFDRIISAASRMQNLIDALLNFSRTNTQDQNLEVTDLNIILNEVKLVLKENIDDKKAVFESDVLPTLPVIPIQIHQLFLNLIGNAIKYHKPDIAPLIKIKVDVVKMDKENGVELDPTLSYWKISFEDNGIGFEQQYENKIFELFQRLHGRTDYSGTGIGLAICKKIVQNHNGVLKAIGNPGVGSVFSIYLPLTNRQ